MHLADDLAGPGIDDVDVILRSFFAGRDIKKLPIRMDRQPIHPGLDPLVPDDRIVCEVEAVDHPGLARGEIGDIEPAGNRAGGDAPDITHARHGRNGFDQPMPGIYVIDGDRPALLLCLVDRVKSTLNTLLGDGALDREAQQSAGCNKDFHATAYPRPI